MHEENNRSKYKKRLPIHKMFTKHFIGRIEIYPPTSIDSPYFLQKVKVTQGYTKYETGT